MSSNDRVVIVYTSESIADLLENSGSGQWKANIVELSKAKYLLCIHHDKDSSYSTKKDALLERGQAFYVGKIKGIETLDIGRKFIQVSEYALLPDREIFKDAWKKVTQSGTKQKAQQNPIRYEDSDDVFGLFQIDVERLNWQSADKIQEHQPDQKVEFSSMNLPDLVLECRQKIAALAKVAVDKVTIKIEF